MRYRFEPMSQHQAQIVAGWHYDPPYDFYDWTADEEDLAELIDPARRADRYFAVLDAHGDLVGFFGFSLDGDTVEVGLGLRPDHIGRGLGLDFLLADWRSRGTGTRLPGFALRWRPSTRVRSGCMSGQASAGARSTSMTPTAGCTSSCGWSDRRDAGITQRVETMPPILGVGRQGVAAVVAVYQEIASDMPSRTLHISVNSLHA